MAAPSPSTPSLTPLDICKAAAFNLYMNGSDARQQKNGNPENLVQTFLNSPVVTSIGVYKHYLSAEDRKIVNDKSKCHDLAFIQKICKIVLFVSGLSEPTKAKDVKACVRIPTAKQMEMLKAGAAGKLDSYKEREINNMLSPRRIFIYQERQKVDA